MDQNELRFYKRREAQALRMAQDAKTPAVAAIHREMARCYREKARDADIAGARSEPEIVHRI